jgi:hypothetical protein
MMPDADFGSDGWVKGDLPKTVAVALKKITEKAVRVVTGVLL